jgi:hypothetical protein
MEDGNTFVFVNRLKPCLQNFRYPVLIDAVIQSSGIGMIGMAQSTMSLLAGLRVRDWHSGVYISVKWGTPNADDH